MSRPLIAPLRWGIAVALVLAVVFALGDDPAAIGTAVLAAGWGVVAIALYRLLPLACDAIAWRALFLPADRPGRRPVLIARWIGESVNSLLPVAQVGGDVVRARLLGLSGTDTAQASASVVVDFTIGLVAQAVFTAACVVLLAAVVTDMAPVWPLAGLTLLAAAAFGGFIVAQRRGLVRRLGGLARRLHDHRLVQSLADGAERIDTAVQAIYRRPGRLAACGAWRLVGWLVRSGETWIALWFLGHPVGAVAALIVEGLSNAARSAGFAVPAAAGVQEGGIIAVGLMVGLDVDTALSLALVKRLRELLVSAPGLLGWWAWERRSAALPAVAGTTPTTG